MKKALHSIIDIFFNKRLDFRVRLFNVLAMAGTLISILMGVWGLVGGIGLRNVLINFFIAILSFALLYYSYKSGRYQICYLITITAIFIVLFPIIFFASGGYHSGMPPFFIFAVLFTVFMLERRTTVLLMTGLELAIYTGACLLAYFRPELVNELETEAEMLIDIMVGIYTVSISLGITMFLHFRMYNRQQWELETAREEAEASKEEALQASEAKSRFLANMSHEIRTPINVILGKNELIMRECDSEQVREYSCGIRSAGDTLLNLVSNILDMSKIEQGKLTVTEENYETSELVDGLIAIGEEYAGKGGLAFHVTTDMSLPRVMRGDLLHLKQVAANFLDNAAKYTKEGNITLSVSGKPGKEADEILLCISVADTGSGIKQENLPILFEAFTRGDVPNRQYIEGTGLGLAIVKELTELMGGTVAVKSKWGEGSVFTAEIPQKIEDSRVCGQYSQTAEAEPQRNMGFIAPGAAVLIVDDNRENRQVIKSLLSHMMLQVDTAESGGDCLEAVNARRYDAILMDYMMPEMDGVETLRRLREIPGFDTPVLALTANVVSGTEEKLLAAGFVKYLSKPVMWRDLELALLQVLPEKLIIPHRADQLADINGERKKQLGQELAVYGVDLDKGLKYLSGDVNQYTKLSAFFIGNYKMEKQKATDLAEAKNWTDLRYVVHALKSKAKAIGSGELSDTAAKLERLCPDGNDRHIQLLLPTLYYEWEQVVNGLSAFMARAGKAVPEVGRQRLEGSGISWEQLLQLLNYNRRQEAMEALDRLIEKEDRPETMEILKEVRCKAGERAMREAEKLLLSLMEGWDQ